MSQPEILSKTYTPTEAETRWYEHWRKQGYFNSTPDPERKKYPKGPYTVVIPPPNVTGVLHMGHMLNNTIQDVLIRRKRMQGYNACWVLGTDHASIATEAKVVQMLRERGIKKGDLTRDEFLKYAWEWKEKYSGIILKQLEKLGASCDWNRVTFTMDDGYYDAVVNVFIDLYNKGYIYRGLRMVNWDPQAQTALSDEEVIHKEMTDKLYYVRYFLEGRESMRGNPEAQLYRDYITVATTRPETIPADVALATWPGNPILAQHGLKGKRVQIPLLRKYIPIIEDEAIDKEFGTGWLKVTPAHDKVDYEIGQRHNLPAIEIINDDGTMNAVSELYFGLDRFAARKQSEQKLKDGGYIEKVQDLTHTVGTSERTGAVIEPKLKEQWWVKMREISREAHRTVMADEVKLIPEKFKNTYNHWMENVKDWCISRQLWWGHRIPAWYYKGVYDQKAIKDASHNFVIAKTREQAIELWREKLNTNLNKLSPAKLDKEKVQQDSDVMDTWFSSWLWPMAVFDTSIFEKGPDGKYATGNVDLNYYYPTNDLVTAPEILFFWVARMIIAGMEWRKNDNKKGIPPFKNVYLTGIVRDKQGRKMSKSLGNSPDPLDLIAKYGADGVRMGMLLCSPAGNDLPFDESLCEQGRNFINKLWNAYKLVGMWEANAAEAAPTPQQTLAQQWMRARLTQVQGEIEQSYTTFRLSEALMSVYKLAWDDFCSWYLEILKPAQGQGLPKAVLAEVKQVFEELLKLLHPFMPFITEEIWHELKQRNPGEDLIVAQVTDAPPLTDTHLQVIADMNVAREMATALRALRAEKNISMKQPIKVVAKDQRADFYDAYLPLIARLVNMESYAVQAHQPEGALGLVVAGRELFVPVAGTVDAAAERARIQKEIEYTQGFLESVMKKLSNEKFVAGAKPDVIARERAKQADAEAKLAALRQNLAAL
jgi:valyl-tRNA synthetase